jgi:hypothetical protein
VNDDLLKALEALTTAQLGRLGMLYVAAGTSLPSERLRLWNHAVGCVLLAESCRRDGVDVPRDGDQLVIAAAVALTAADRDKALAAAVMTAEEADDPAIRALHGALTDVLKWHVQQCRIVSTRHCVSLASCYWPGVCGLRPGR